jgi:hypothetical protein
VPQPLAAGDHLGGHRVGAIFLDPVVVPPGIAIGILRILNSLGSFEQSILGARLALRAAGVGLVALADGLFERELGRADRVVVAAGQQALEVILGVGEGQLSLSNLFRLGLLGVDKVALGLHQGVLGLAQRFERLLLLELGQHVALLHNIAARDIDAAHAAAAVEGDAHQVDRRDPAVDLEHALDRAALDSISGALEGRVGRQRRGRGRLLLGGGCRRAAGRQQR